ncbi:hypothetical protein K0U27_06225 [archaeon]|nr:hypothetical protein [archaeon]
MSLQWKLTLQRINLKNSSLILFGILCLVTVAGIAVYPCGIEYFLMVRDAYSYEQSYDPEFCEVLVERIYLFNDRCESQMEIFDCG